MDELEAWIVAYIEAESLEKPVDSDHPAWWAVERFMNLKSVEQAEAAWSAMLGVLARQPSERILGVLAAGPLEDIINYWGPHFIDRIERAAWENIQFRKLLTAVWQSGSDEIWKRVQRASSGQRPAHT